ncbi:DNA polymerase III subunit beta [Pelagibacterium xiamenense]|uniref:DNA polymerase III subunit beta n=1 Tax=Pelagibacterium xiamenense TaxID=2901140 RepID=UPI001E4C35AC|nr:DNA polymerase III subunit beta [Pelagibacterium xiamenense]MCD7058525.1 DNA polymerase III subunit beta [Pelagibacterium xiamenense]
MKVTLERNHLLKSLGHVHRVVERRNTYPILANVLMSATAEGLDLRATDLDIEVTETVPAMTGTPGVTTVPAHTLYEIVRKLSDGAEVVLETDGADQMSITSGRSRFHLACLNPDGFPDLKSGSFTHTFSIPAEALKDLIERTQFAISNEETRYYLNGIFIHTIDAGDGIVMRAVATDGHRLARVEAEAPSGSAGMPGIIVPRKTVSEVLKLLDGVEGDVEVELSDTKIRFTLGGVVLLSKLIEGSFPDYERVTPKNNDKLLRVDRDGLAKAVDRVSTIASERGGKAVKLSLSEGMLELSVTNPDHGTANEELAVEFDVEAFEIGFNARYLLEIISQIRTENALFLFNDAGSPTLVKEDGETQAQFVLMPMRV